MTGLDNDNDSGGLDNQESDFSGSSRERVLITGPPKAGKTTLAGELSACPRHTDVLIDDFEWSEQSEVCADWFDQEYEVIEGTMIPRALRKWLTRAENTDRKPCDRLIILTFENPNLTRGQKSMTKSVRSVLSQIEGTLLDRGVILEWRDR